MLAAYLGIPFPRNRRPNFESCVLHGHVLHNRLLTNAVCVLRDGRDVMVSAYYHRLFRHEIHGPKFIERTRSRVPFTDYENVEKNLPAFIEYMFEREARGFMKFRWDEFAESWLGRGVPIVRYEDLLRDPVNAMSAALASLLHEEPDRARVTGAVDQFSFANVAKRKPGTENIRSFLRKGIAGDWRNKFTREACEVFDHYAGNTLISLGYEADRSWVSEQPPAAVGAQ
jgi:hypothetical protein